MRNILRTMFVTSASVAVIMAAMTFNGSSALASSHKSSDRAHSTNPAIDMIVTGSNKNPVKINNPSAGNSECGLCFHRDTINKRDNRNTQKPAQAYPGN